MIPKVLALTTTDVSAVSQLAALIWRHHYTGMISSQQIDYMLTQRYQPELIRNQLRDPKICWEEIDS